IESTLRELCRTFNYEEIRTPTFEHTEVFQRGVGETTDIVQKEMYTFQDRGDRSITLRPEGTAGVVELIYKINFMALLFNQQSYFTLWNYFVMNVHNKVECVNYINLVSKYKEVQIRQ